jgi:hypothetical protein
LCRVLGMPANAVFPRHPVRQHPNGGHKQAGSYGVKAIHVGTGMPGHRIYPILLVSKAHTLVTKKPAVADLLMHAN